MNEMLENWSLPWHTLQRSLAEAFGAEAQSSTRAKVKSLNAQRIGSPTTSWLVRARISTLKSYRAGR